jgi:hypothetical protein
MAAGSPARWGRTSPLARSSVGNPAGAVGVDWEQYHRGLLQGAGGLHGVRVGVGKAVLTPIASFGAKATLEHTWHRKGTVAAGNTFVGPEVQLAVGATVMMWSGVLWRVDGDATNTRRWSWGVGLGF